MGPGVLVKTEPFREEENHGDIVHPCVRFIEEGFEGHKWWLVYTPYYHANAAIENPILCYAESNDAEVPPKEWRFYCLVNEKPVDGYNSDPTLLFQNGELYIYWRENIVTNYESYNYKRATFVAKVKDGKIEKCNEMPVLSSNDQEIDTETCPTFMRNPDGTFTCYAMHLKFHSKEIKRLKTLFQKIVNRVLLITDLLGVYSQQKHFGVAIWKGSSPIESFTLMKTVRFRNCNKLYRPWHMDFFDYRGKRYSVIQTNMSNADLCLAESNDGEIFTFFSHPLITNKTIGKVGIYKPCAGVTRQGVFYLYYSAQDMHNRGMNRLYLSQMSFDDLINQIK